MLLRETDLKVASELQSLLWKTFQLKCLPLIPLFIFYVWSLTKQMQFAFTLAVPVILIGGFTYLYLEYRRSKKQIESGLKLPAVKAKANFRLVGVRYRQVTAELEYAEKKTVIGVNNSRILFSDNPVEVYGYLFLHEDRPALFCSADYKQFALFRVA